MFSNDLSLNLIGVDLKRLGQVNAESQAVQEGAGAQYTIMPCADAGNVSEGIGGSVTTNMTAPGAAWTIRGTMSR